VRGTLQKGGRRKVSNMKDLMCFLGGGLLIHPLKEKRKGRETEGWDSEEERRTFNGGGKVKKERPMGEKDALH